MMIRMTRLIRTYSTTGRAFSEDMNGSISAWGTEIKEKAAWTSAAAFAGGTWMFVAWMARDIKSDIGDVSQDVKEIRQESTQGFSDIKDRLLDSGNFARR